MLHGPKDTQTKARALRAGMSLPEVKLWQALRARPAGLKFRRQHPAGPYVLDFFCAGRRLAVEVDGEAHNRGDRPARDACRDAWLAAQGVVIVRISATELLADVDAVVRHIVEAASSLPPLHHAAHGPPPLAGDDI
ncbi:endonuclease domain-containing protein [Sphingomonas abietis]|uniref:Endonuclease domain-containing protein n=1 Tax=Sphingomonas abietis TaxID=3012344 RepID=A0ABY7NQU7_9SPHN|nr:endonuclease domain-containing protein [Sphingomonas abietis]WBO22993.1 endonuclease domain-containing protein [Sphingomonas abietis]